MSRRNEDFDENCDPECPRILRYEDVMDAATRTRPFIINTPVMAAHTQKDFGIGIYYKLEFMQRSGSFKERGALNVLHHLPLDKKKLGIVMASNGNEAIGMCYHAAKLNVPVIVVMPITLAIDKMQRCHGYGAKVVVQGNNLIEAQKYARALARDKGLTYINGRDHPHIIAGYGTMALEILEVMPFVDAVLVPVGSGGLAAAMATVIKHQKPSVLVYGVQPEQQPTFFESLQNDEPVSLPLHTNVADAITLTQIGVNAYHTAKPLLDKMLLVKEDWVTRAMLHLSEREKFIVEGAGACSLAAIIGNLVPELKSKNVVCLLTGGNCDNVMLVRCLERGLSAEGRLVKFRVGVRNDPKSKAVFTSLIAAGGYNIHRHFQDQSWTDGSDYYVEFSVICETKGLAHALELKRTIEKAYPCTSVFENEPFNDKRTCPCYIKKIT
ncbi:hypothetical protein PYW07_007842 [Mythimna separata]|uniref:L-serine deaminase n=1 Tax=Mythimna separata TaxID=271217 RepID=A0AAD7YQJ4_MYTSE|nr:hypothetical protein PYW07_007842 [Mythimna separata]